MGFITVAGGPPARGVAKPQARLAMAWGMEANFFVNCRNSLCDTIWYYSMCLAWGIDLFWYATAAGHGCLLHSHCRASGTDARR
jgi:hypothetical protein